ncbi:hypothetical protein [Nocardiopsis synnemataformans]|uniref:hypothetical protein n=1 Tax=Nocardiopsis synnemataformans TaxID=61305 RepID=UPI003EBC9DE6
MSKSRWGGSSGPTSTSGGRVKRAARAARDWADDRTGRKASSAFKAARKERGFRARSKAASRAVRKKGGGKVASGIVGIVVAAFTGLASLFGGSKKKAPAHDQHAEGTSADSTDDRPGYVDRRGLGPDHPGYTTGRYDANIDPRTWEQRVAAGDVPEFIPKTSTSTHTGGTAMTGLPAAHIAADMAGAMSRYEPDDAWTVLRDARQWPDVFVQTAYAVKNYADVLETARFPLNPAIVAKMREVFEALSSVHDIAEEIEPLMRRAHAEDIARQEARRGDERKWNV